MLGKVFALPVVLLIAASPQSTKVDEPPPISVASGMPRDPVPAAQARLAAARAPFMEDESRQGDAGRRALLTTLRLNSGGHMQPFGGTSR